MNGTWHTMLPVSDAEPRIYRTAPGFWGLGFTHSASGHLAFQFGPWVFTTEPEGET